jgi:hypothetical protein
VVHNHQAVVGSMGPCDFLFLESLQKHLASKTFSTDSDVKQTVTSLLQTLDTDFFNTYKPWRHNEINASVSMATR